MYRKIFVLAIITVSAVFNLPAQDVYLTSKAAVSLFSETAIENIDGHSKSGNMALNTANGDVYATVSIRSFEFKKSLMQEHFNENYMESDKYPTADFTGHIEEKLTYTKDGDYNVTIKGKFKIHGVQKEYTIPGKLTVKDHAVSIHAVFNVKLEDHKIDRPTVVAKQLADTIKVSVDGTLEPKKT